MLKKQIYTAPEAEIILLRLENSCLVTLSDGEGGRGITLDDFEEDEEGL